MLKYIFIGLLFLTLAPPARAADNETAFERVMKTQTIRCGYYVFPPSTNRDPNTGKMSGYAVDMMNRLAERAGLKVEWTEEVTFGNWVPALQAKRFDVVCTAMWPDLPQAKVVAFTHPMFFAGKYPTVLASDPRFTDKTTLADLNNDKITFTAQEGNITLNTTKMLVPKAKLYVLPPNADPGEFYQSVATKKSDAMIVDANGMQQWNKNNPKKKMKFVDPAHPVALQQFPMVIEKSETDLLNFLNLGIDEMNYSGEIDSILKKWEADPGKTFLRVASPVQQAK